MAATTIGYKPNKQQISTDKKPFKDRKTSKSEDKKSGKGTEITSDQDPDVVEKE